MNLQGTEEQIGAYIKFPFKLVQRPLPVCEHQNVLRFVARILAEI